MSTTHVPEFGDGSTVNPKDLAKLSAREMQILRLFAQGLMLNQIGPHLGIALGTVHKHMEHVRNKLCVNRTFIAALALQRQEMGR